MERCPAQAVLPLVGLAAEKVIRDRYNSPTESFRHNGIQYTVFSERLSINVYQRLSAVPFLLGRERLRRTKRGFVTGRKNHTMGYVL
ncbi:MAG: hypothetical protein ACQESR_25010 [Planctomycetota bacterium]